MTYATKKTDRDVKSGKVKCSGNEVCARIWIASECGERKAKAMMDSLLSWLNNEMENGGSEILESGDAGWSFSSDDRKSYKVTKF